MSKERNGCSPLTESVSRQIQKIEDLRVRREAKRLGVDLTQFTEPDIDSYRRVEEQGLDRAWGVVNSLEQKYPNNPSAQKHYLDIAGKMIIQETKKLDLDYQSVEWTRRQGVATTAKKIVERKMEYEWRGAGYEKMLVLYDEFIAEHRKKNGEIVSYALQNILHMSGTDVEVNGIVDVDTKKKESWKELQPKFIEVLNATPGSGTGFEKVGLSSPLEDYHGLFVSFYRSGNVASASIFTGRMSRFSFMVKDVKDASLSEKFSCADKALNLLIEIRTGRHPGAIQRFIDKCKELEFDKHIQV